MRRDRPRFAGALLLGALLASGCATTDESDGATTDAVDAAEAGDGSAPIEAPAPWIDAFTDEVRIFADVITVDGPAGLRTHCAIIQDDESFDYELEAKEHGLVHTLSLKPGAEVPTANVYLDNWKLHAFQRVVVTERPTDTGEVVVRATGKVGAYLPDGRVDGETFVRRFRVGAGGDTR